MQNERATIQGPAAWYGADLDRSGDWIRMLNETHKHEIAEALERVKNRPLFAFGRAGFPLYSTADLLADISEELARLGAHTQALRGLLGKSGPVGKEIEFLLQEVNREVNTIGAKSQNAELSRLTVQVKGALEKIREQVQNVE
jgi:hypothetical protein